MMTQELTSRDMQLQALCDGVRKYVDTRNSPTRPSLTICWESLWRKRATMPVP